ncbi:uncharacterized protein MONOS_9284 [Monocercomonoides exilis]|uniref:uncharacterized protein n=1 Tax=Monocercomonoides exilis TaxID=2049356 RepID=UPI00355AB17B|nr:hypothetical protein MONOS_9284 [Monocercomonoides exilis]|eukprot:MONOS_9284.1-p1 / transcript=MONOS_9284.1 / gene=MONOS_9284 / organism=Monocercomonoides_exilis_PA203 / gene_product=unspecified product / transcript_product=unspecified product / location=Mono_scaffold00377:12022-16190(-) / protein_length=1235 / sequence_SO=supercontig / SO=protein_coding / is_pseudo=false
MIHRNTMKENQDIFVSKRNHGSITNDFEGEDDDDDFDYEEDEDNDDFDEENEPKISEYSKSSSFESELNEEKFLNGKTKIKAKEKSNTKATYSEKMTIGTPQLRLLVKGILIGSAKVAWCSLFVLSQLFGRIESEEKSIFLRRDDDIEEKGREDDEDDDGDDEYDFEEKRDEEEEADEDDLNSEMGKLFEEAEYKTNSQKEEEEEKIAELSEALYLHRVFIKERMIGDVADGVALLVQSLAQNEYERERENEAPALSLQATPDSFASVLANDCERENESDNSVALTSSFSLLLEKAPQAVLECVLDSGQFAVLVEQNINSEKIFLSLLNLIEKLLKKAYETYLKEQKMQQSASRSLQSSSTSSSSSSSSFASASASSSSSSSTSSGAPSSTSSHSSLENSCSSCVPVLYLVVDDSHSSSSSLSTSSPPPSPPSSPPPISITFSSDFPEYPSQLHHLIHILEKSQIHISLMHSIEEVIGILQQKDCERECFFHSEYENCSNENADSLPQASSSSPFSLLQHQLAVECSSESLSTSCAPSLSSFSTLSSPSLSSSIGPFSNSVLHTKLSLTEDLIEQTCQSCRLLIPLCSLSCEVQKVAKEFHLGQVILRYLRKECLEIADALTTQSEDKKFCDKFKEKVENTSIHSNIIHSKHLNNNLLKLLRALLVNGTEEIQLTSMTEEIRLLKKNFEESSNADKRLEEAKTKANKKNQLVGMKRKSGSFKEDLRGHGSDSSARKNSEIFEISQMAAQTKQKCFNHIRFSFSLIDAFLGVEKNRKEYYEELRKCDVLKLFSSWVSKAASKNPSCGGHLSASDLGLFDRLMSTLFWEWTQQKLNRSKRLAATALLADSVAFLGAGVMLIAIKLLERLIETADISDLSIQRRMLSTVIAVYGKQPSLQSLIISVVMTLLKRIAENSAKGFSESVLHLLLKNPSFKKLVDNLKEVKEHLIRLIAEAETSFSGQISCYAVPALSLLLPHKVLNFPIDQSAVRLLLSKGLLSEMLNAFGEKEQSSHHENLKMAEASFKENIKVQKKNKTLTDLRHILRVVALIGLDQDKLDGEHSLFCELSKKDLLTIERIAPDAYYLLFATHEEELFFTYTLDSLISLISKKQCEVDSICAFAALRRFCALNCISNAVFTPKELIILNRYLNQHFYVLTSPRISTILVDFFVSFVQCNFQFCRAELDDICSTIVHFTSSTYSNPSFRTNFACICAKIIFSHYLSSKTMLHNQIQFFS